VLGDYGKVGQPDTPSHIPKLQVLFPLHCLSDSQDLSILSSKHLITLGGVGVDTGVGVLGDGSGVGVDGTCGHPEYP